MANSEGRVSHYLEPPVAPHSFPRVFHSCTESSRPVHNEVVYVVNFTVIPSGGVGILKGIPGTADAELAVLIGTVGRTSRLCREVVSL